MPFEDNPLFRRLRKHAQKRLSFEPSVPRSQQLPAYKRFVELENEMLKRYHHKGDSGLKVCQARTAMIDVVIENLFLAALDLYMTKHGKLPCKMAVLATGGYGRAELNPHSDIDIMFLYPNRISNKKRFEQFQEILAEEILYPLWDLGWKIGHASRNTKEVLKEAGEELQSKNAILEARMICGSEPVFFEMKKRFMDFCKRDNFKAYIKQRLIDEKERHSKTDNTVYLQEPDIKNGVGGLRDYQNILWMANLKFSYKSFRDLEKAKILSRNDRISIEKAYDFLLRTRTEVHFNNRRQTDKLILEQQPTIAEGLLYPQKDIFQRVEAFMKDYYTAARTIYHTSDLLKERLALSADDPDGKSGPVSFREAFRAHQHLPGKKVDGFILCQNTFSAKSKNVFKNDPIRLIRIFRYLQQFGAKLDPDLKFLIARSTSLIDSNVINSESAAKSFCSILRSPGEVFPIFVQMHDLNVLGRYLPEFGQLTCMVQHEYYHRYTADMHVLRTIKHLDDIFLKSDEVSSHYKNELRKNDEPLLLYLILLLHDIGKAEGVKGHDIAGVRIAKPILNRLGIHPEQQKLILFIIRSHLEMARIWQKHDLENPQTAKSFANYVDDPQKLRFLYVHTYCDARGTAPTLWNSYKDFMHRSLYKATIECFKDRNASEHKRKKHKGMLNKDLIIRKIEGISEEEIDAHFSLLPERYFINSNVTEIALHLRMVHQLFSQNHATESMSSLRPVISWCNDLDLNITVINVIIWDRTGLFYKIAGALTLASVNITSTKAISRKDHIAIATFYVMSPDGGICTDAKAESVFRTHLEETLIEGKHLHSAIDTLEKKEAKFKKKKDRDILPAPFPPSIGVYYDLSLKRTIIEVQVTDRIGLLYRLTRLIYSKGFNIEFARIATERGVTMDTFYIESKNPKEQTNTMNLLELREGLDEIVRKDA